MDVLALHGDEETIRAFAAQVTRSGDPRKLLKKPKYSLISTELRRVYNFMVEGIIKYLDKRNHFSTREFNNMYLLVLDTPRLFSFYLMTVSENSTFEQQSQRYTKTNAKNALPTLEDIIDEVSNAYNKLVDLGIPNEDARYLLPQGVYTNFVMKTNLREIENLMEEFYSKEYPKEMYEFIDKVIEIARVEYPISSRKLVKELKEFRKNMKRKKLVDFNVNFVRKIPHGKLSDITIKENSDLERKLKMSEGWFEFEISLSAAHQLIRHRKMEKIIYEIGDGYVVPKTIYRNKKAFEIYTKTIEKLFKKFEETKKFEYLPNATITKISGKENPYMFIENIVSLRTCYTAQWEIRGAVNHIKNQLEEYFGGLPLGRCRVYLKDSKLKELFPTKSCPEDKKDCPIYKMFFSKKKLKK